MKIQKKKHLGGRGGEGSGWGGGGQGGCDRRIEVFGNIHKKNRGVEGGRFRGGVGGVRVGGEGGQGGCE